MSSIVTRDFRLILDVSVSVDSSEPSGITTDRFKSALRAAVLTVPTVRDLNVDTIVEVTE